MQTRYMGGAVVTIVSSTGHQQAQTGESLLAEELTDNDFVITTRVQVVDTIKRRCLFCKRLTPQQEEMPKLEVGWQYLTKGGGQGGM